MKHKTKRQVQKIFLTTLVVLFGIEQSATAVFSAPIPDEYTLTIVDTDLEPGDSVRFFVSDKSTPTEPIALDETAWNFKIFYNFDSDELMDNDEIYTIANTELSMDAEHIFSFSIPNTNFFHQTKDYNLIFFDDEDNSYIQRQFSIANTVTEGDISVTFEGNDVEILESVPAGATVDIEVALQFNGNAQYFASDLTGGVDLHLLHGDNEVDNATFIKNEGDSEGIYHLTIPEDLLNGAYEIKLSQPNGLPDYFDTSVLRIVAQQPQQEQEQEGDNNISQYSAFTHDADHNGYLDGIIIESKLPIQQVPQLDSLSMEGYTISEVTQIADTLLDISVIEGHIYDTGVTPLITILAGFDGLAQGDTLLTIDRAHPIIVPNMLYSIPSVSKGFFTGIGLKITEDVSFSSLQVTTDAPINEYYSIDPSYVSLPYIDTFYIQEFDVSSMLNITWETDTANMQWPIYPYYSDGVNIYEKFPLFTIIKEGLIQDLAENNLLTGQYGSDDPQTSQFIELNFDKVQYIDYETVKFITAYQLDSEEFINKTLKTAQVSLYADGVEIPIIEFVTAQNLNGNYAIDLSNYELIAGEYYIQVRSTQGLLFSDIDGNTQFYFTVVESPEEDFDPDKTFTAHTADIDSNGHLDRMHMVFPDAIKAEETIFPIIKVEGYLVTNASWGEVDAEGFTKELWLKISKTDVVDNTQICNNQEGNICETGLTPKVTLLSPFQQIGNKIVTAIDKANPIIYMSGAIANPGAKVYTKSLPNFSEPILNDILPNDYFMDHCPLLEECIFVVYANEFSTNTFSILEIPNKNTEIQVAFGDPSKYPFPQDGQATALPKLLITQDGLVMDLAGNPLLANATHPITNISLSSTDNLDILTASSSFDVSTSITYLGFETSVMNLPQGVDLMASSSIDGLGVESKGNGVYTISLPTSTPTGTYHMILSDEELPLEAPLAFTVVEKTMPTTTDEPGDGGNLGGNPGGSGPGIIPTNKAPHAVIKEVVSSIYSGISTTVDGSLSTDPENNPIFFSWNFGDGTATTELSTLDAVVTHTYLNPGTYTITLKVQDSNQASDTTSTAVIVLQSETVQDTSNNAQITTSTPTNSNQQTTINDQATIPQTNTQTPNQTVAGTVVDTNDETVEETEKNTEEVLTPVDETEEQVSLEESSEEELPDWLAWVFGSSSAVAAVWTGLLANRYRKYVA